MVVCMHMKIYSIIYQPRIRISTRSMGPGFAPLAVLGCTQELLPTSVVLITWPEPWLSVHPGNLVNPRMGGIAGSPYDRCWSNLLWMISHDLTNFQMNPESSPKQHLALPKHVRSRPLLEVHVWKGGSSPLPDPCFHMHFAGKLTAMWSLTINRITLKVRDFHQNYCPVSKWEAQLSSAENHGSGSSDENGSQSLLVHLLIFLVLTHPHHHLNSHTVTHIYIYYIYSII